MSYYGNKTFRGTYFSVLKNLVEVGQESRFTTAKSTFAYKVSDFSQIEIPVHHSGVYFIKPQDSGIVVIRLLNINPNAQSTFDNIELIDVSGTYNLPAGKWAVVLEGLITCSDQTYDANVDLGLIKGDDSEKILVGTGKILSLNFTY